MENPAHFEPEGRSEAARRLRVASRTLARNRFPVLVTGEIGVGKLRFARLLHELSERPQLPFRRYNCAEELSAFPAAWGDMPPGGTFVLEHIDEASSSLQKSIAKALSNHSSTRGSFRVVATTRRDLAVEVLESRFLTDLFFRLRVYSIELPPLRERKEDICMIARTILEEITKTRGSDAPELTADAIDAANHYHWPGNIRELRNELIRCAARAQRTIGKLALVEGLDARIPPQPTKIESAALGLRERVDAYEKQMIDEALTRTYGNRDRAATLLGITRRTLQRKLVYHKRSLAAPSRVPAAALEAADS